MAEGGRRSRGSPLRPMSAGPSVAMEAGRRGSCPSVGREAGIGSSRRDGGAREADRSTNANGNRDLDRLRSAVWQGGKTQSHRKDKKDFPVEPGRPRPPFGFGGNQPTTLVDRYADDSRKVDVRGIDSRSNEPDGNWIKDFFVVRYSRIVFCAAARLGIRIGWGRHPCQKHDGGGHSFCRCRGDEHNWSCRGGGSIGSTPP